MRALTGLVVVGLLAGCASGNADPQQPGAVPSRVPATQPSSPSPGPTTFPVLSQRRGVVPGAVDPGPAAAWAPDRRLDVTTWGSSGCPLEPRRLEASGPSRLVVSLNLRDPGAMCVQDYGPTTSTVKLPTLIRTDVPLVVELRREPLPGERPSPATTITLQPVPSKQQSG